MPPAADARVQEANPNTNYGSSYLRADGGSDPDVESYLRFTVTGVSGPVQSAKLRVYAYSGTANGPAVHATGAAWSETAITWSNRPGRTSAALDDKAAIASNSWVEYDVTSLVQGNGDYGFVLAPSSTDGVDIYSREGAQPPQLLVTASDTADTQAPSAPSDLTATAKSATQVDLAWTAASDDIGVTDYEVYRDEALLARTAATGYTDTAVTAATTYAYKVRARDRAGNVSASSATAIATTPKPEPVLTVAPEADARVHEASATKNFGTSYLRADGGSDPDVESYLRFSLAGLAGPVQSAKLRLYASQGTVDGPAVYATGTSWAEKAITWANRPGRTSGPLADAGAVATGGWVEYDVSSLVTGSGTYSFALATTSTDGVDFHSREAATNRPELRVTADAEPPETIINSGPRGPTASAEATFTFSASEDGSTFACSLDGAPFSACRSPHSYSGLAEGAHTFQVTATDLSGKSDETPASRSWTVDTIAPPPPEITSPPDESVNATGTITLAGVAEAASTVELFDGAAAQATTSADSAGHWTATLSGIADGAHTYTARARDAAGNGSPPSNQRTVVVEASAPETAIDSGPSGATASAEATFTFSASEDGSTFACSLDGAPFSACRSPHSYSGLAEGAHTFQVSATDPSGKSDETPASRSWRVDATAPEVTVTSPAPGTTFTSAETVTIAVSASDNAGVSRVEFFRDGTLLGADGTSPFGQAWPISSADNGPHSLTAKAYDAAGNSGTSEPVAVVVDIRSGSGDPITATVETDPVRHTGDAADDAAVWIHPSDTSMSTILGTDKDGGLAVYDLSGRELYYYADSAPNNVDLRYNFLLGEERVTLVATSDRSSKSIRIYRVDPGTRGLEHVSARTISVGISLFGLCMYRSPATGRYYVFVNDNNGQVEQWELVDNGAGKVNAAIVRSFDVGSVTEGCVADDELGHFYVSEEDVALWKYNAEPGGGTTRTGVDSAGAGGHLTADIEGLAIYYRGSGAGYLLASSQGNDSFVVYERGGANAYITTFGVAAGAIDGVSHTDGLDVTNVNLGSAFPDGAFIAQDDRNDAGNQNFKLVPWGSIARSVTPTLVIDTSWDPRLGGA